MALAFESPRPNLRRSNAFVMDSPGMSSMSSVAGSPKSTKSLTPMKFITPMKHLPKSGGKHSSSLSTQTSPIKTPKPSMKSVPSPKTPVKTSRKDKAVTCAAMKKVVKTAIQKPKNKASVLKKPAAKQISAKAKCSAKAKVEWIQDEQLFEDDMDQCYMEYEDAKGYNKSFRCPPPCTWTQLLIPISDVQLKLLFLVYGCF